MIKLLFLCANLAIPNKDTLPNQLPLLHPICQAEFKYISSEYGWRIDPTTQDSTFHEGIDIATISPAAAVYATADGIVETLDYDKKRGLFIIINHAFGFQTQYFHLDHFFIRRRQSVKAGEKIGLVDEQTQFVNRFSGREGARVRHPICTMKYTLRMNKHRL